MKKRFLGALTALFVCLSILSACGQNPSTGSSVSAGGGEADPSGGAVLLTCRIISGAGEGELLLAEQGEGLYGGTGVYTLSVGQIPVLLDGASASAEDLENGMLVEINCSGMVEETFPARLSGVTALSAASGADGGFDNLCTLYLQVLEDLWRVDDGLNQGITELGVDLSQTRLTVSERWHGPSDRPMALRLWRAPMRSWRSRDTWTPFPPALRLRGAGRNPPFTSGRTGASSPLWRTRRTRWCSVCPIWALATRPRRITVSALMRRSGARLWEPTIFPTARLSAWTAAGTPIPWGRRPSPERKQPGGTCRPAVFCQMERVSRIGLTGKAKRGEKRGKNPLFRGWKWPLLL